MISAFAGSIWIRIISTMNALRPVNRNFARATAAKNASTIDSATTVPTTMRLFFASVQKYGVWIASWKCSSVGCSGIHVGLSLRMSLPGLNAVEIIQNTGNAITANTSRPTAFQPARLIALLLHRGVPGRRRRRTHGQSPYVLRSAPMSGASFHVADAHHLAHVEEGEPEDDAEHEDRDRGAEAVLVEPDRLLEEIDAHQVVVGVRSRLQQQERLREDAEVPDDRQARQDQEDRLQDGERDVPEPPERTRPVNRRSLEQLVRHLGEAGVDRDRHERDRAPHDERGRHAERRRRRRVPVVLAEVAEVQARQHVVDDAVLEVRHPVPELYRDHDG